MTVAKDDGKSDCKKDGWTDWVREDQTAFADQDECVAYVAKGGTLTEPAPTTTFQSVCLSLGGLPEESHEDWVVLSPACYWGLRWTAPTTPQ